EPQVADDCGGNIDKDALAAKFTPLDIAADEPVEAAQPAALAAADEWGFQLANQYVLVIAQHAAGLEQPFVGAKDAAYDMGGEIVERQAGNDVIVGGGARQILHGSVDQLQLLVVV